ncbi:hypothetical protein OMCYN_01646 [cyanobiont of Ornithocercus magnificus]|nr:hypothetical protein OMCYN_01646 [cyanobiont of Ornithocercus magnificus]
MRSRRYTQVSYTDTPRRLGLFDIPDHDYVAYQYNSDSFDNGSSAEAPIPLPTGERIGEADAPTTTLQMFTERVTYKYGGKYGRTVAIINSRYAHDTVNLLAPLNDDQTGVWRLIEVEAEIF